MLEHFHLILWLAILQMQYELDLPAGYHVRLRFTTQFVEVGRFEKELQSLKLRGEYPVFTFLEKLTQGPIVLALGLSLHAGIKLWLKL